MTDRLDQLHRLHEADPLDPFLTYGIALEHGKSGRFEEALTWLDRTLGLDPAYCYAYFQKAKMYGELGRDDDARAVLAEGMAAATKAGDDHARSEMAELLASFE